jgi:hypothetical protein
VKHEQLLKAINADLDSIQTLMKSYKSLEKADGPEAPVAAGEEPAPAPEAPEAEGWDPSSASNEELLSMLEELMQIVESRLGGEQGGEAAPEAPAAPEGGEGGEPLAMAEGDEEDMPELPQEGEGEMEPEAGESPAHEGMESPEMESTEQAGEAGDVADMGGEGEIEVDESPEALQQEIAALSPEEIQKLKAAVDAVVGQQPASEEAPGMEKSAVPFKKALPKVAGLKPVKGGSHDGSAPQKSNLVKSLSNLCDGLEQLAKQAREPQGAPVAKYADANLRVLEKSVASAPQMDGPTLANWLLTEQRKGNKLVKSLHVAAANCAKSSESLTEVYNTIKAAGITPP